jgi:hypothetical protein
LRKLSEWVFSMGVAQSEALFRCSLDSLFKSLIVKSMEKIISSIASHLIDIGSSFFVSKLSFNKFRAFT